MCEYKRCQSKTLFIQNLPYSATNEQLEELFSNIGPLKKCFVVKNKDSDQCRGFGYVTFALLDDVLKAKSSALSLGGRKLLATEATSKATKRKRTKSQESDDDAQTPPSAKTKTQSRVEVKANSATPIGQLSKEAAERTVVLLGISSGTSTQDVENLVGNMTRVRQLRYPVVMGGREDSEPCAAIVYRGKRDAVKAVVRLNKKELAGAVVSASLYHHAIQAASKRQATKPATSEAKSKKGRLIIRNLAFRCEVGDLRKHFAQFGEISEVSIPLLGDGRKRGFGIVQFVKPADAAKAMECVNGTTFLDRPIAVDWAVSKDRYINALQQAESVKGNDGGNLEETKMECDADDDDDDNDGEDDESIDGKTGVGDQDEDEENSFDKGGEESDGDDGDDDDDDEDDEEEEDDDHDSDDDDNDDGSLTRKKSKLNKQRDRCDADQGLTVFIRNLPFDTEEDDLRDVMSQFGDVMYCRMVVDPETEHPKGTAFVKYKSKESISRCLEASQNTNAQDGDGLSIRGRKLTISLALSRDKVKQVVEQKKQTEQTDGRNLHLIRESFIRLGTEAAEGLSKSDMAKRMKVEAITRQKLRNPNIFVSTTRLCVRNVPVSVDDHALKKICLTAANNTRAKINECRIMRDLKRVGQSGLGKSRGFAFVNFTEHADALQALRHLNNNPAIFGEKRRPIVEFSLENKSALMAKQKRLERAAVKQGTAPPERPKVQTIVKPPEGAQPKKGGKAGSVLPTHRGPKIRHKKRVSQVVDKKAKKRDHSSNIRKESAKKQKRVKHKKKVCATDNVDTLVQKYRQKLTASKWF